jgi:hypothetical protein
MASEAVVGEHEFFQLVALCINVFSRKKQCSKQHQTEKTQEQKKNQEKWISCS